VCAESDVLLVNLSKHCTHPATSCIDCHRQSITTDIKSKGMSSFTCAAPNCNRKYEPDEYYPLIDAQLIKIVDKLLLSKFLESNAEFRWCKSVKGCGAGQLVANHRELLGYYTCHACGQMMCFRHSVPWHTGFDCTEFDAEKARNPEFASNAAVAEFTKQCPNEHCKTPIMKHEGCDVMTCCRFGTHACGETKNCDHGGRNYCGQRFCWICLGKIDINPITKAFIRHCKPNCKYSSLNG